VASYFSYRQYYPDLASRLSHRPYSPRLKRDDGSIELVTTGEGEGSALPVHQPEDNPTAAHSQESEQSYTLEKRPGPGSLTDVWRETEATTGEEGSSALHTGHGSVPVV
jgi:diacylglycerol diphosphate phosphatase / phosphatidate phosphatase